jgi:sugar transferase (PEP-CTERM system associated)
MRFRLHGKYVPVSISALVVAEAGAFYGALILAALVRFRESIPEIEATVGPLWPRALLFSGVLLVSVFAFGLYSVRQRARRGGIFIRLAAAIASGTAVTTVAFYILPDLWLGRGVVGFAALGAMLGSGLLRAVFHAISDDQVFKRNVLVFGAGVRAHSMSRLRRRSDRRGFNLIGFVQPEGEGCDVPAEQILDAGEGLLALCERHGVDEVVVAMDDRRRAFPISDLLECRLAGIEVTELLTFLERETGRVRIDALNPSWMIFGEGFRRDPVRLFSARALDVVASSLIIAVTWPLMLLTALAIKLEDGWDAPVLYRQERVGLGGRTFRLFKFRSMRIDAERDGQARWAEKNDPRVTRVGSVIRKLRIDELPQILNVLRGHMSFVGPRPERPEFVRQLADKVPYYVQRHSVRPGITGWAQLCYQYGSSEQDALEKLQYDLYYIKNNSFLFDLAILVQTAEVVFMGKGAR